MDPVFHFVDYLRQQIPGIKLVEKKNSRLMKFLGFFAFFNPRFMTTTTTVVGKTIYLPSQVPHDLSLIRIIAHEYVHLKDYQRWGWAVFLIKYSLPQCLALFSVFAFLAFFWWQWIFALLWVFFLFPWDASQRLDIEKRAYTMSLLFTLWTRGSVTPTTIQSAVDTMHGPAYYWPGGSPVMSRAYFETTIESAKHGVLPPEPAYADVWRYLSQEKYLIKPT